MHVDIVLTMSIFSVQIVSQEPALRFQTVIGPKPSTLYPTGPPTAIQIKICIKIYFLKLQPDVDCDYKYSS